MTNREQNKKLIFDTLDKIRVYLHTGYSVLYDSIEVTSVGWEPDLSEIWIRHGGNMKTMLVEDGYDDLADMTRLQLNYHIKKYFKVYKEVEL